MNYQLPVTVFTLGHAKKPLSVVRMMLARTMISAIVDVRLESHASSGRYGSKLLRDVFPIQSVPFYVGYEDIAEVMRRARKQRVTLLCAEESFPECQNATISVNEVLAAGANVCHISLDHAGGVVSSIVRSSSSPPMAYP